MSQFVTSLSPSRIADWRGCQRMFAGKYLLPYGQRYQQEDTSNMDEGNRVHKICEDWIHDKNAGGSWAAPEYADDLNRLLPLFKTPSIKVHGEQSFVHTFDWGNTHVKDWAGAFYRQKIDVLVATTNRLGMIRDWKTGSSKYTDEFQLRSYVISANTMYPNIREWDVQFYYLNERAEKKVDRKIFDLKVIEPTKQEIKDVNDEVRSAVQIHGKFAARAYPACKSFRCRFCPVSDCENYVGG